MRRDEEGGGPLVDWTGLIGLGFGIVGLALLVGLGSRAEQSSV